MCTLKTFGENHDEKLTKKTVETVGKAVQRPETQRNETKEMKFKKKVMQNENKTKYSILMKLYVKV